MDCNSTAASFRVWSVHGVVRLTSSHPERQQRHHRVAEQHRHQEKDPGCLPVQLDVLEVVGEQVKHSDVQKHPRRNCQQHSGRGAVGV